MIDPMTVNAASYDDDRVEPFRIPNAAELIADHLRRQIVRGELEEGSSLPPEGKLRERFGVSGPTLRAAYRVLESEGLISVRRGSRGGATVHRPQLSVASRYVGTLLQAEGVTLNDLFGARTVLEPPLAGLAARNATKAGVKRLRDVLVVEESTLDDGPAFARATTQFHKELVHLAGNQTLTVLASLLWDLAERHMVTSVKEGGDDPARLKQRRGALQAHRRLVDLIGAKDAAGAEAFWSKHMAAVAQIMSDHHGSKALVDLFA